MRAAFFSLFMTLPMLGVPQASTPASSKPMILKISVLSSGAVLLDGKATTMRALEGSLKTAKTRNGQVWYYREAVNSEPSSQAMAVIKLVVDNKLPISLSTKPDFSDYVDERGQSRPRAKN
jgi:hypothetical protein